MKGALVFALEQIQQVWVQLTAHCEINRNADRTFTNSPTN